MSKTLFRPVTLIIRLLSAAGLLVCLGQAGVSMASVHVETRLNPSNNEAATGGTAVRFEDYVSNPQPGKSELVSGIVAKFKSPFSGLLKPGPAMTTRSPLPASVGIRVESDNGVVLFADITKAATCSDLRVTDPLTLRFVVPDDPDEAAGVSDLSIVLVGAAVQTGTVEVSVFDADNQPLVNTRVTQGDKQAFRGDVRFIATEGGQPVAAIHRVVVTRKDEGKGLVLGAGMDVQDADLTFDGFAVAGSQVVPEPESAPAGSDQEHWSRYAESIRVTDLRQAAPAEALSDRRQMHKWKIFEYETADFSGHALAATTLAEAPPVTITLDKTGWYAVYLGLSTIHSFAKPQDNEILARLSGDRTFGFYKNTLDFSNDGTLRRDRIQEVYLGVADLTDQDVVIDSVRQKPAFLAYIKCVPLTDDEVQQVKEDRMRSETRTAIATFDGHSMIWPYAPRTAQDLANTFTQYAESDFGTWWFQVTGADLVNYKSAVGNTPHGDLEAYPNDGQRSYGESINALIEADVNVVKVAIEEAHRADTEILIFSRVGGWKGSAPWEEMFSSDFYEANPQWRTIDRDGTPAMYMSYAYPEVQDHIIDMLRESVGYGADGAGLLFHRGMPMMLWEDGFLNRFAEKYHADAREVPEDDERIHAMRAEIVTEYLRKIRQMLDEIEAERGDGKHLKLAVSALATEADNAKFGLDIKAWAHEGLVDQVASAWFAYHTSGLGAGKSDVAYYADAVKGTDTQYYPFIIGWKMNTPQDYLEKISEMYRDGADGIVVWDPHPGHRWGAAEGTYWGLLKDIGHREQVLNGTLVEKPSVTLPLTRMGGNHYSRWQPNTGF